MSSIAVPDHVYVTIREDKTLEHMSAANEDATFNELMEFALVWL